MLDSEILMYDSTLRFPRSMKHSASPHQSPQPQYPGTEILFLYNKSSSLQCQTTALKKIIQISAGF